MTPQPAALAAAHFEGALAPLAADPQPDTLRIALEALRDGYQLQGLTWTQDGAATVVGHATQRARVLLNFRNGVRVEGYTDDELDEAVLAGLEADVSMLVGAVRVGEHQAERGRLLRRADDPGAVRGPVARRCLHDLINKLTIVLLDAECLRAELGRLPGLARDLDAISRAATAGCDLLSLMRSLGDHINSVPMPAHAERELVDLLDSVDRLIGPAGRVHVESSASADEIMVDRRVLRQLLMFVLLQHAGPDLDTPATVEITSDDTHVTLAIAGAPATSGIVEHVPDLLALGQAFEIERAPGVTRVRLPRYRR